MISDQDMRTWLVNYILIYKWADFQMDRRELIWSIICYPLVAPICLILLGLSLILSERG